MPATSIKSKWGIVINRSKAWPDVFVKHVARWCARKTGLSARFTGSAASWSPASTCTGRQSRNALRPACDPNWMSIRCWADVSVGNAIAVSAFGVHSRSSFTQR